MFVNNKINS